MKAICVDRLGAIDNGALVELPEPAPGPGQVLIDVEAVAVNYVDIVTITGRYQFKPTLPYVPGKHPAGVVRALGEGVRDLQPGHRVLGMSEGAGFAQRALVVATQCYRLPDTLSFVDAAAMALAYDTAWVALKDRARLKPGETVLVLGASGAVGHAAVQLAKAFGAKVVLGAVASTEKFAGVLAAGADRIIDLSQAELRESVRAQVFAATNDQGADVIVDPLGGDVFEAAIRAIAWRGRLVVLGFAAGAIPSLKLNYLLVKNAEVTGLQISDYRRRMPELVRQCYDEVFALYEAGQVRPQPSTTLPLRDYARAMHLIAQRQANGRVVLLPQDP